MILAPFAELSPDFVLDAISALGLEPDGRLLALNSFENRVYQVGLVDAAPVIAKFYRPDRHSSAAILEEHAFADELAAAELPVVAPLRVDGESLFEFDQQRLALFPRRGGRAPELEGLDVSRWLGRLIARMHLIGARSAFQHRTGFDIEQRLFDAAEAVLQSPLLPTHLADRYPALIEAVADRLCTEWAALAPESLRLHGDCHPGNVLWTDSGPHFVDLDDACQGPAVQDLWMLMVGPTPQRQALLEGYAEFRVLPPTELRLIPALRLLRQIHHAGWIAARFADPAFPRAFPFVRDSAWWDEHCNDLAAWLELG